MIENVFQGHLFNSDFLTQSVVNLRDDEIYSLSADLTAIYSAFSIEKTPNVSRTEDDLIRPIFRRLGWFEAVRQQKLTVKGRDHVPDEIMTIKEVVAYLKRSRKRRPTAWSAHEKSPALRSAAHGVSSGKKLRHGINEGRNSAAREKSSYGCHT